MNNKKLRIGNIISFLLIILFSGLIIFSSIKIIQYIYNTKETINITKELEEYIQVPPDNQDDIKIDFNKLKEENSDTVAWLRINNTNINYPVVKGKDNEYYLNHNFNKKWSNSGWIYANYLNKVDGSDDNLVIFGHAMKNKTMFGELNKTLDKDWLKDETNQKIQLIIGDQVQIYKIFSVYKIEAEDYYITTGFSDEEFNTFKSIVKDRSIYDFNVNNDNISHILTLSTCFNKNNRIVIHAYRIDNN